jgi:transposase
MEAYSTKVRELVLDAYDQGTKTKEIATTFKVSRSWARRVKQRLREQGLRGSIQQKHGPDPILNAVHRKRLGDLVRKTPDATVAELKEQLAMPVSVSTISRALVDMKLTLKKSRYMPASKIVLT